MNKFHCGDIITHSNGSYEGIILQKLNDRYLVMWIDPFLPIETLTNSINYIEKYYKVSSTILRDSW